MKEQYVGKDCEKLQGVLKLRYPMKNGVFQNEQDILTLFNHIYNKLDVKSEEIKEHPIFITEPILNPYSHRKQIASALFDILGVPALFFGSQPILSLFASGEKSGVIMESGESITQCCVVYEGYSIPHSYLRYDFGGKHVTDYLQTLLKRQGYSFNTTAEYEIVKKIKELLCYTIISSSSTEETKKLGETGATQYFLPDGNFIMLKEEKVLAPEIMFNPSMVGLEYLCKFIFSIFLKF
jgi:centractin